MRDHRLAENPFFVLELGIEATAIEVTRRGQKLLGQLALGLARAATYESPLGVHPRSEEAVRAAVARLLTPEKRFFDEIWARADLAAGGAAQSTAGPAGPDVTGLLWWTEA